MIDQLKKYIHDYQDHKLMIFSVGIVAAVLYYSLIWVPLHTSVIQLRKDVTYEQKVLDWLVSKQK